LALSLLLMSCSLYFQVNNLRIHFAYKCRNVSAVQYALQSLDGFFGKHVAPRN